eukprot:11282543-Alexandrium_andersonii.AAC.1
MLRLAGRGPAAPGQPGSAVGWRNQPARPARPAICSQSMGLAVEPARNDSPVHDPAMNNQPGKRPVQLVVLVR